MRFLKAYTLFTWFGIKLNKITLFMDLHHRQLTAISSKNYRQSATANVDNEVREKNSVSEVPRRKITKESLTKEENRKLWECYLRSKPKKRGYRKRMHGIRKQEGIKEVRE